MMKNPPPRMPMLDRFNEGWIAFDGGAAGTSRGATTRRSVLRNLAMRG